MTRSTGTPTPSPHQDAPRLWHVLVSIALAALGFFLTFSSAGVLFALAALVLLAGARSRAILAAQPWKEPVMATGLVLLAYIALHTLWTTGLGFTTLHTVNHYQELLFAPMLLALLQDSRHRQMLFRGLIAGATLLAIVHWIEPAAPGFTRFLATRRISAGFTLAVCAFVLLMRARGRVRPWPSVALASFLALTVLFAIEGRTGYIVLLLLLSCAAWLYSPPRWRWIALVATPVVVLAVALGSGAVETRVKETLAGAATGPDGALTSTGIRIEMLRVAGDLARRYAVTGAGFANYAAVHEQAARLRFSGNPATERYLGAFWTRSTNPHNEYLLQLIGGGAVALALYLAWLGMAFRQAARLRAPLGSILAGSALAFAVGSLFNSLLMDFVEAHFYMALLGWVLAENRYGSPEDERSANVRRILVVATRQIGDVLLTTPLIHAARARWPQARIEVLGFQGTLGMVRGHPDVDGLIETPARPGWRGTLALVRRLWRRYDLALVTDAGDRAHLMGFVAAPMRSGIIPAGGGSTWWKKLLLDHALVAAGDLGAVHVTSEKQSLLAPWLRDANNTVPQVVPPTGAALPPQVQSQLTGGAVVLHAPSMWPYKQWPIAHFEVLVKALLAEGRQVVLTGSAGDRDQECIAPLRSLGAAPQLLDLSGQLDFNQLVTLFQGAALYIGPDTSISHLAAATGVPVIAIFGPTNPMRWAPWPARAEAQALFARSAGVQQAGNVTVMQSGLSCVPCGRAGCEDHRQSRSDCLVDITPERVLEQALKVLAAGAPRNR